MPFHGVLPERRYLFKPEPLSDIGVNDKEAWRLNPKHRHIYNKLELALWQGLMAAPSETAPAKLGIEPEQQVFVKPIRNLAGMSLNARTLAARDVPREPGSFWCTQLMGQQTSSDCFVQDGKPVWFAHTQAACKKNKNRPVYWEIGVDLPENEIIIRKFLDAQLSDYTGLLNVEIIDGYIIEAHLRGSNAFFDFYGQQFIPTWVRLMDENQYESLSPIPGGVVYSVFSDIPLAIDIHDWPYNDVSIQFDNVTPDRLCILRGQDLQRTSDAAKFVQDKIINA